MANRCLLGDLFMFDSCFYTFIYFCGNSFFDKLLYYIFIQHNQNKSLYGTTTKCNT